LNTVFKVVFNQDKYFFLETLMRIIKILLFLEQFHGMIYKERITEILFVVLSNFFSV